MPEVTVLPDGAHVTAADGETVTGRPAHDGSTAQGNDWSGPVGTRTSGRSSMASGRSRIASMKPKMEELAPIASPIDMIAVKANPRFCRRPRMA